MSDLIMMGYKIMLSEPKKIAAHHFVVSHPCATSSSDQSPSVGRIGPRLRMHMWVAAYQARQGKTAVFEMAVKIGEPINARSESSAARYQIG